MVARGGERVGQLAENIFAVVVNLAGLAVKNLRRANDFAAERRADGLMAETHTENREFPRQSANQIDANSSVLRCAWTRRNYNAFRLAARNFLDRNFVVAMHLDIAAQFAEILRQVVGERIVVVEQQNHKLPSPAAAMRGFEGGQEGARFVDTFLILAFGCGIGDDSASGLHVRDAICYDHGAQRDAGIQITSNIHLHHASGIDAAARAFQLFDNFHGANFGRAGNGSGRKAGHQRVEAIHVFTQTPAQAGDDVHDVRKTLDGHELLDFYGAVIADTAEIVAAKVDEHNVLGALFFAGEQLLFQALIVGFVLAAGLGPGNGAVENVAALDFDEHFGGAAHDGHIVHLQKE